MCDFLFNPQRCRLKPAEMGNLDMLQATVMAGAFSTGNGEALRLVQKYCVKFRQMSARNQASVVSHAWQQVRTHDNGLQLLNARLHSEDTDLARALLEFSTFSECSECAGAVQNLFHQEEHSLTLNFERFTLYMDENYKTLLDARGQHTPAPWICTEELWIGRRVGHDVSFSCDHVLWLCARFYVSLTLVEPQFCHPSSWTSYWMLLELRN